MEGLLLIITIVSILVYKNKKYKETAYYQITKNPYSSIKYDKGKYGEYLTYKRLQHFESSGGKFLFNAYIPKYNNETTEIDMLLICSKGLFVFESKNYSGWIFGNEVNKNWTQTFPKGRGRSYKERFYNPIMQNGAHIKHLKRFIGKNLSMRSIIVFSDGCTLKDITIKSNDVSVVNHHNVSSVVTQICSQTQANILTQTEINNIYDKLYSCTQVSCETRERHIQKL